MTNQALSSNTTFRASDYMPWYKQYESHERLIQGRAYYFLKRLMDLSLCLVALPLLAPLFVLIAIAIYIDSPGKVMFKQYRTGRNGRRFPMYKFRTMVPNAEELKKELAHLNELQWPDFKITNDPRVTRVGGFLRKTSLDELPQLINVIKGDMSLVGPRPTSFTPQTYELWHTKRLEVTPGLTGLGQVCGRSDLEFDDRLKLDIAYIERQCISLDIQILVRTALEVFNQKGAY